MAFTYDRRGILGPNLHRLPTEEELDRAYEALVKAMEEKMSAAVTRCKVRVFEVVHVKDSNGNTESERVTLCAVYGGSEENKQWSKLTPSAQFSMTINNPAAIGRLSSGHEYYVDFIPVPKQSSD